MSAEDEAIVSHANVGQQVRVVRRSGVIFHCTIGDASRSKGFVLMVKENR